MPPNAKDEFPEVEQFVRIISGDNVLMRKGNIKFQEENAMWADSAFFKVFDFKLLKGNPNTALERTFKYCIFRNRRKKIFW